MISNIRTTTENDDDFHLTEGEDLAPNRHILNLMLKNQKLISTIENKKKIVIIVFN